MANKKINLTLATILLNTGCAMFQEGNQESSREKEIRESLYSRQQIGQIDRGTIDVEEYKERQEKIAGSEDLEKYLKRISGKITFSLEKPLKIRKKNCKEIKQYFFAVDNKMQTIIFPPEDKNRFQNLRYYLNYAKENNLEINLLSIPMKNNSYQDIYFPELYHIAEIEMFGNRISYIHDDNTLDKISSNRNKIRLEKAKTGYKWFKKASEFVPGY